MGVGKFSNHTQGGNISEHTHLRKPFIVTLWLDSNLLRFKVSLLELVMTGECLSKVCCLGTNEEVVLLQNLLFGQMSITISITMVKIRWNDPCLDLLQVHQAIAISVPELGELLSFTGHPVRLMVPILSSLIPVHVPNVFINIDMSVSILIYVLKSLLDDNVSHVPRIFGMEES